MSGWDFIRKVRVTHVIVFYEAGKKYFIFVNLGGTADFLLFPSLKLIFLGRIFLRTEEPNGKFF